MDDAPRDTRTARVTGEEALAMHAEGRPGKLETRLTKPLVTARDLSLAYSPGVAEPCLHIHRDPSLAYDYTAKGNFVAVISNGTAVLGLGNLGALASKPVMEGKVALFKRFADVDGIDLCIDTEDVDAFVNCGALPRAQLRRHQPRGHQGARVLRHRAAPARADGHPGLPRRPARHRHRRRRRADQRLPPDRARPEGRRSWSSTAPAPPPSPAPSCSRPWACGPRTSSCATPRA